MIRGAIYQVDLGDAKRGHEQRGRRLGLVLSPTQMPWSLVTIVPTSIRAQPAVFRPEIEIAGRPTKLLVDQIRSIDIAYVKGDPIDVLGYDALRQVERAVLLYLGLDLP